MPHFKLQRSAIVQLFSSRLGDFQSDSWNVGISGL
jgi:hypothetical protein